MPTITLADTGWTFDAAPEQTLLEAAQHAGIVIPSSCRNGSCRTCLCHVASGVVRYRIEWPGVSIDEKRAGYILPCVACAETDLVIDGVAVRRAGSA